MGTRIPSLRVVPDAAGEQPASLTTLRIAPEEGGEKLFVLSRDRGLIDTLEVVGFPNDVRAISREADLALALIPEEAAVVLLDSAAVSKSIERLTEELKAQFPDIVLIVTGGASDQTVLSSQITQGTVYRFLAKPLSPQRIKLFLDAAWRRRAQQQPGADPAARLRRTAANTTMPAPLIPPVRRSRTLLTVLLIAAIAVIAAGTGWLAYRKLALPSAPSASTVTTAQTAASSTAHTPTLDDLLKRGDAALAHNDLITPPAENAASLYSEAQRLAPSDPRVVQGVNRVMQKLLAEAQTQLHAGHIDMAQQLTRQAWTLDPNSTQVAMLLSQLAAAREPAPAPAPSPARTVPSQPATPYQLPARARSPRLVEYLRRAQERLREGNLIDPEDDSARYFIAQARALAPADPAVREVGRRLLAEVTRQARNALAENRIDDAQRWVTAASQLGARPDELGSLTGQLQQDRAAAKAAATNRMAELFNQRLTQGKLLDPADDCAKLYLAELMRDAPDQPATQLARQAFQGRLLVEAQSAVRHKDFSSARRWLAEAREAGVDSVSISAVDSDIRAAQTPAAPPSPPPVALKLVHYVEPDYPDIFRARRLKGRVVIQFTVKPDGATTDVSVLSATLPGDFGRAAIEAVSRWKYAPVRRNGLPISVRARIRVNFAP